MRRHGGPAGQQAGGRAVGHDDAVVEDTTERAELGGEGRSWVTATMVSASRR